MFEIYRLVYFPQQMLRRLSIPTNSITLRSILPRSSIPLTSSSILPRINEKAQHLLDFFDRLREAPFLRRGLLCQALVRERFLAWKALMTFRRVNSSRSFSSSASVMKRMVSLKPGMTMFFRALARFCVFLMAVARR